MNNETARMIVRGLLAGERDAILPLLDRLTDKAKLTRADQTELNIIDGGLRGIGWLVGCNLGMEDEVASLKEAEDFAVALLRYTFCAGLDRIARNVVELFKHSDSFPITSVQCVIDHQIESFPMRRQCRSFIILAISEHRGAYPDVAEGWIDLRALWALRSELIHRVSRLRRIEGWTEGEPVTWA